MKIVLIIPWEIDFSKRFTAESRVYARENRVRDKGVLAFV